MKKRSTQKQNLYGSPEVPYVFLAPTLLLFVFVFIFPISFILYSSFFNWNLLNRGRGMIFIGLGNYWNILKNIEFWKAFFVTIKFVLITVPLGLLLGLALALLLNRRYAGKGILQSLMLLPLMVAPVSAYLSFKFLLEPTYGLVNHLLSRINITGINWFAGKETALISVAIVDIWSTVPFIFLVLYAGMQVVPEELYEAAVVDGANSFQMFRRITLPSIKPVLMVVSVIRIMDAIRIFENIYALTKGGPASSTTTIQYLCYNLSFESFVVGKGSAMAIIIVLVILFFGIGLIVQLHKSHD